MSQSQTQSQNQPSSELWNKARNFIGGYGSGMALVAVGHPFDTLKVRLQTNENNRFSSPLHCLKETVQKEGFMALYKGVTPPLFATGVINSLMFGMNSIFLPQIQKFNKTTGQKAAISEVMATGFVSGFWISFVVTPIEGVKSKLQVQYGKGAANMYQGPVDCIKKVLRSEGILGLYKGWAATAYCRVSNWSYFGGYEFAKRKLQGDSDKLSFTASILAGGFAGFSFWFACYPVDVIKARQMASTEKISIPQVARTIMETKGWKGFFQGFTPCLLRAFPANAAAFVTYEFIMSVLPK